MASTSSGIVNSNHVAGPILTKSQCLNIIQRLLPEQSESNLTSLLVRRQAAERNILGERVVPYNLSVMNNRSNRRNLTTSPEVHDAIQHGTKFVTWLKKNGTPIASATQVNTIQTIMETLVAYKQAKNTSSSIDKENSIN